jgi:lactoylglutathione lyase
MISAVAKVLVPVDDQVTAQQFWTKTMGFDLVSDEIYGTERWIEVTPPEHGVVLVLTPRRPGMPRREAGRDLPHSDVIFACDEMERTYAELAARGVKFPTPPVRQHLGWWAIFEDPDGTRYALSQRDRSSTEATETKRIT